MPWLHGLKQRPKLLNGIHRPLVHSVNDVPWPQVRCVNVRSGRPGNDDDSGRVARGQERRTDSVIQVDNAYAQAVDDIPRIDQVGKVVSFVPALQRWNQDGNFLGATQHVHLEILVGRMQVQSRREAWKPKYLPAINSIDDVLRFEPRGRGRSAWSDIRDENPPVA